MPTSSLQPDNPLLVTAWSHRADPEQLSAIVKQLLSDAAALESAATRHPNGFVKVVLDTGSDVRLRLHVWPASSPNDALTQKPHGHRWPFASWIITGFLCETTYATSDDGASSAPFEHMRYVRRGDAGTLIRTGQGAAQLAPVASTVHVAGAVYARKEDDLHSAEPQDGVFVATLVVQGEPTSDVTSVYRRPGARDPEEGTITASELRPLLVQVTDALRRARQ